MNKKCRNPFHRKIHVEVKKQEFGCEHVKYLIEMSHWHCEVCHKDWWEKANFGI